MQRFHLPKPEPPLVVAPHEIADVVCPRVFAGANVEALPDLHRMAVSTGLPVRQGAPLIGRPRVLIAEAR